MLEQLSDQIRLCHERAAEAKERADATNDPAMKAEFLAAERRWLALAHSYGFTESLEDFTRANSEQRRKFDEHLQQSNALVAEIRKHLDGPDDILQLHEISTSLIQESNIDSLHSRILDAAIGLMSSDMASMQLLDPERNQLRLLAWKGFHPQSAYQRRQQFVNHVGVDEPLTGEPPRTTLVTPQETIGDTPAGHHRRCQNAVASRIVHAPLTFLAKTDISAMDGIIS
jgi:hypothetical protein